MRTILLALAFATPALAQEPAKASYTIDEYVEARRPVIVKRQLTGEEKARANKLVAEINSALKSKERPSYDTLEQLAPLAETGDKAAMIAMMLGYREAGPVKPLPADAFEITAHEPAMKLSGLWGMMLSKDGDRSKDTSKAIDGCWRQNNPPPGICGFTVKAKDDYQNVFNLHWSQGKAAPKDVVFTEFSLKPSPEKQKERFNEFVARLRDGDHYTAPEYLWAEVWAKRTGGDYAALLEKAAGEGRQANDVRAINAKLDHDQQVAAWEKLQARRHQAKAQGGKLPDPDEAQWIALSHRLGGKYLVPFASENVLMFETTIDSLCRDDDGPVCQRQKQLYQYRAEAALSERNMREAALRNMTLGGRDVSVRTYDSSGNYLGTTTMPAWQADIAGAQ